MVGEQGDYWGKREVLGGRKFCEARSGPQVAGRSGLEPQGSSLEPGKVAFLVTWTLVKRFKLTFLICTMDGGHHSTHVIGTS